MSNAEKVGIEIFIDSRSAEIGSIRAQKSMTNLEKSAGRTDKQFQSLDKTASLLGTTLAGLFAAGVVAAGVRKAISEYAEFEKALVGVAKTANLSESEARAFGETIENMSLKIPKTTVELLGIAEAAGQLGITGTKNLEKFADTIARLDVSSDLKGGEAATTLARILNVTGEGVESVDVFASVIVSLGNSFAASESEIANMANEVARSTAVFDVTSAKAAALGAVMRSLGIQSEAGGSAVGRTFRAIDASIRDGGDSIISLSNITGIAAGDLQEAFGEDSTAVFQKFMEGLGRAMDEGKSAAAVLDQFGLKGEEVQKTLPVLAKNSSELGRALNSAASEIKNTNALLSESERAFGTLDSDLVKAGNASAALAKAFGNDLSPSIRSAAKGFADFVGDANGAAAIAETTADIITTLAFAYGTKLTIGLGQSTAAYVANTTAKIASVKASQLSAAAENKTALQMQLGAKRALENAQSNTQRAAAITRLAAANQVLAASEKQLSAANLSVARTATAAGVATRAMGGAMAMLGGPAGMVTLAASALLYFVSKTRDAEDSLKDIENRIDSLNGKGEIIAISGDIDKRLGSIQEAKKKLKALEDTRINLDQIIVSKGGIGNAGEQATIKLVDNEIAGVEKRIALYNTEVKLLEEAKADAKKRLDDGNKKADGADVDVDSGSSDSDLYKKTNDGLQRQIALYGEASHAAQLKYDLEFGSLSKIDPLNRESLIAAAEKLDLLEKEKVATEDLANQKITSAKEFAALENELDDEGRILETFEARQALIMANTEEGSLRRKELLLELENQTNEELLEVNGSFWERYLLAAEDSLTSMDDLALSTIEGFSSGIGGAFESMIFDAENFGDAMNKLGEGMARSVVNALGKMAAEWLAYQAIQMIVGKTTKVGAVSSLIAEAQAMSIMAGLNAFSSTAAIPIVGPAAAPAASVAAIAATSPMAQAVTSIASAQLASFDGGGFTPDIPRFGGVDGKGGFYAIMHGNEEVIDHTKGNSKTERSVSIVINNAPEGEHKVTENRDEIIIEMAVDRVLDEMDGGRVGDSLETRYGVNPGVGARR